MKKIKLLTGLVGIASLTAVVPTMAGCSCNGGNTPTPTPTPTVTKTKFIEKFKALCRSFLATAESKTYELKSIAGKYDGYEPTKWNQYKFWKSGTGSGICYELDIATPASPGYAAVLPGSVNFLYMFNEDDIEATLDLFETMGYTIKYSATSNQIGFTCTASGLDTYKCIWNSLGLLTQYQLGENSNITMTYQEKEETEKDKFGKAYDKLIEVFDGLTTKYKITQLSDFVLYGTPTTINEIEYTEKSVEDPHREFNVTSTLYTTTLNLYGFMYDYWEGVSSYFAEPGTGVTYTINTDGSIEYENTDTSATIQALKVNKYGYIELYTDQNGIISITYTGDPVESWKATNLSYDSSLTDLGVDATESSTSLTDGNLTIKINGTCTLESGTTKTGNILIKNSAATSETIKTVSATFEGGKSIELKLTLTQAEWAKVTDAETLTLSFEEQAAKTATVAVGTYPAGSKGFLTFQIIDGSSLTEGGTFTVQTICPGGLTGPFIITDNGTEIYRTESYTHGTTREFVITLDSDAWDKITTGDTILVNFEQE